VLYVWIQELGTSFLAKFPTHRGASNYGNKLYSQERGYVGKASSEIRVARKPLQCPTQLWRSKRVQLGIKRLVVLHSTSLQLHLPKFAIFVQVALEYETQRASNWKIRVTNSELQHKCCSKYSIGSP